MERADRNKIIMFIAGIGVSLGVFLFFKFMFPIVSPFIIAFLIAYVIEKPVEKLAKVFRGNKLIAASLLIFILTIIVGLIIAYVGYHATIEIKSFINKYDYYMWLANCKICDICELADGWLGLSVGTSLDFLNSNMDGIMSGVKTNIIPKIMGSSIPIIVKVGTFICVFFIVIMSVAFISKDLNRIRNWREKSMFAREVTLLSKKVGELGRVYFKVQLLIILSTTIICIGGLLIIKNPYAVVMGICIGLLDALPLFGTGTVLIPWSLWYVITGKFIPAAILFTVYVITYFIREILEAKLMGHRLGIAPFTMMVIIFAGLVLYGLLGFILGPISYVIIKESLLYLKSRLERGNIINI